MAMLVREVEIAVDVPAAPPVLLLTDGDGAAAEWFAACSATGQSRVIPIDLRQRIDPAALPLAGVAVAIIADHASDMSAARISASLVAAAAVGCALIVEVPPSLIDEAAAVADDATLLLCDPDFADRVTALTQALQSGASAGVQDSSVADGLRLKRLADEVNRIARALSHLSDVEGSPGPQFDRAPAVEDVQFGFRTQPSPSGRETIAPAEIRSILRLRRMRERFFPGELFADPAWDMLLDLFAARMEGDNVAVSSLCIAAAVPPTTALRWIKTMTDADLFERHADPMDGRRIFIRLSDRGVEGMRRYFDAVAASGSHMV